MTFFIAEENVEETDVIDEAYVDVKESTDVSAKRTGGTMQKRSNFVVLILCSYQSKVLVFCLPPTQWIINWVHKSAVHII